MNGGQLTASTTLLLSDMQQSIVTVFVSRAGYHGGVCTTSAVRITLSRTVALHELLSDITQQRAGVGVDRIECSRTGPHFLIDVMQCDATVGRLSTYPDDAHSVQDHRP